MNLYSLALTLIATLIGSFGAIYLKKGSKKILPPNFKLIFGLFLYAISAIIYVVALKKERLSVLYPIISIGYIWISLLSMKFLDEKMNKYKWFGISLIIIGIILVGFGS